MQARAWLRQLRCVGPDNVFDADLVLRSRVVGRGALNHEGPTTEMSPSDMFTSQLAEQEVLNGPSLEKVSARYRATLRSSTGSGALQFTGPLGDRITIRLSKAAARG
jgi:hypothetical protein